MGVHVDREKVGGIDVNHLKTFCEWILPRDLIAGGFVVVGFLDCQKTSGCSEWVGPILIAIGGCYFGAEIIKARPRKA